MPIYADISFVLRCLEEPGSILAEANMTETTFSELFTISVHNPPCDTNTPFSPPFFNCELFAISSPNLAILHVDQIAIVHALADIGHVGSAVYCAMGENYNEHFEHTL